MDTIAKLDEAINRLREARGSLSWAREHCDEIYNPLYGGVHYNDVTEVMQKITGFIVSLEGCRRKLEMGQEAEN